jgi:hypothetical protein
LLPTQPALTGFASGTLLPRPLVFGGKEKEGLKPLFLN